MTKRSLLAIIVAILLMAMSIAPVALAEAAATPAPETETLADTFSYDALADDAVLVTVNGEAVTKADINDAYQYYAQQYAAYGLDLSAPDMQRMLINYVASMMAQNTLLMQKAKELGFDQLTDEEKAAVEMQAKASYDNTLQMYGSYLKDDTKSDEENQAAAEAFLAENGYTVEALIKSGTESKIYEKVTADIYKDINLTEDDYKAAYDAGVAAAQAAYDADIAAYETAKSSGATIYYTPAGIRNVKHILIKMDNAAELKELYASLETADEATRPEIEAKIAEAKAAVQPKLDDIASRLAAGEDFQVLLDEYGEDGGMKAGSANAETGYPVSAATTNFVAEFKDGAMALEKIGDVGEPVLSSFGYHIIRYESDVPSGVTAYEAIADAVAKETLEKAQSEAFTAKMQEWIAASDIQFETL